MGQGQDLFLLIRLDTSHPHERPARYPIGPQFHCHKPSTLDHSSIGASRSLQSYHQSSAARRFQNDPHSRRNYSADPLWCQDEFLMLLGVEWLLLIEPLTHVLQNIPSPSIMTCYWPAHHCALLMPLRILLTPHSPYCSFYSSFPWWLLIKSARTMFGYAWLW
jgi:hypothetical protein